MLDRIDEEVKDAALTQALSTTAIKSAIKYYERQRFWFMESTANTLTTSTSQEFYSSADQTWVPNVIELDSLEIVINSTTRYTLTRRTMAYIDDLSTGPADVGQPQDYCYYARQFRFWPIPDAAYQIAVRGLFPAATLSTTTDTNTWMVEAEDLIRARAKWDIYTNLLKDEQSAGEAKNEELDALSSLDRSDTRRVVTGRVTPMAWV